MNTNYISIYKILVIILLLIPGCGIENTYKIITPAKLSDIYLELNTEVNLTSDSSSAKETDYYFSGLLKKYGFTENDFKYTIEAYNQDITKWKEFYENLIIKLEKAYTTSY